MALNVATNEQETPLMSTQGSVTEFRPRAYRSVPLAGTRLSESHDWSELAPYQDEARVAEAAERKDRAAARAERRAGRSRRLRSEQRERTRYNEWLDTKDEFVDSAQKRRFTRSTDEQSSVHTSRAERVEATQQGALVAKLTTLELPRFELPRVQLSLRATRALIALVLIAVSFLMLYGPACTYYAARRDAQVYATQLATLNERNSTMMDELERLQTREGIEDEARRHGFISPGDVGVSIEGVDKNIASAEDNPSIGDRSARPVDEDLPFYIAFLDALFQYQPTYIS